MLTTEQEAGRVQAIERAMRGWNDAANEFAEVAEYDRSRGAVHEAAVQDRKAGVARRTVVALGLEYVTGKWHCVCCLRADKQHGVRA